MQEAAITSLGLTNDFLCFATDVSLNFGILCRMCEEEYSPRPGGWFL